MEPKSYSWYTLHTAYIHTLPMRVTADMYEIRRDMVTGKAFMDLLASRYSPGVFFFREANAWYTPISRTKKNMYVEAERKRHAERER